MMILLYLLAFVGAAVLFISVAQLTSEAVNDKYWTIKLNQAKYKAFYEYMNENTNHCSDCESSGPCKFQPRERIEYGWNGRSLNLENYGCPFYKGKQFNIEGN